VELQSLGKLEIFGADLGVEEDFDAPISGCELVFQFATTANFASEDPEVHSILITHYNWMLLKLYMSELIKNLIQKCFCKLLFRMT